MFLSKIEIFNYQSHKQTVFNFDKGFNLVHGETDHGKSILIKVINWVVTLSPRGFDFACDLVENPVVKIILTFTAEEQVIKIIRTKDKKTNAYRIEYIKNSVIVKSENFDAIKTSVPQPVIDILCMSDLNIRKQADGYFLLWDSPGQINEYINSVTIGEADAIVKKITSWVRKNKETIEYKQTDLEKKRLLLDKRCYKEINQFEILFEKHDTILEEYDTLKENLNKVTSVLDFCSKYKENIKKLNMILNSINIEELDKHVVLDKSYIELEKEIRYVSFELESIQYLKKKQSELETVLKLIDLSVLSTYEVLSSSVLEMEQELNFIVTVVKQLSNYEKQLKDLGLILVETEKSFQEHYVDWNTCLECGNEITEDQKQQILINKG